MSRTVLRDALVAFLLFLLLAISAGAAGNPPGVVEFVLYIVLAGAFITWRRRRHTIT